MAETVLAQNPNEAATSTEASATLATQVATETDNTPQTQTTEAQTATAAETATETQTTETAKVPVAPEKYEFTAPEGVTYDSGVLEAFSAAAKAADLSQDAAQKLLVTMAPAIAERQQEQIKAIHKEWLDASTADMEFGGEKLKENLGVAKKAYDALDPVPQGQTTTPLRTFLETTGIGNHPEIIRLLYRAGKAISEDTFVGGKAAISGASNPAAVLYDNTK